MEKGDSNDKKQLLEEIIHPSTSKTENLKGEMVEKVCKLCGSTYTLRIQKPEPQETSRNDETASNVSDSTSYMSLLGLEKKRFFAPEVYPTALRSVNFTQLSRRPVNCPASKCGKVFAITQIINHFFFDHKKFPSTITTVNQKVILDIDVNKISVGETAVLALLAIPRYMDKEPSPINIQLDNAFVFLVFGTKQALSSRQQIMGSFVHIWVSGYVHDIFNCTVEVYSEDRSIFYNYHGAVNSLRDSNNSSEIFKRADGLLLHSVAMERMSQNEYRTMKLQVKIGCKDVTDN